eukprot:TRINITY_DN71169_c0_g1_i1.p1 TRINITY_DN71169_c0_g1~~TRINITY_DN71169_c0_g1_i1.p1  ORF type:complete len:190 (-),score=19.93 TRINITY_DN71169_c0_g1_i1:79-594(-)
MAMRMMERGLAMLLVILGQALADPSVGTEFPEFTVHGMDHDRWTLEDFKGQRVLLWWYPKADTPGCTKQGEAFTRLNDYFSHKGVQVVGISADSPAENMQFATKYGFSYPLLSDEDRTIPAALGITERRWAVLISSEGIIETVWSQITDPERFPAEALSGLRPPKSTKSEL